MGSKKKAPKQQVADYHMTLHVGVCSGPIDALKRIYMSEKEVWNGNATANTTLGINLPELFGGQKKEGGVGGSIHLMLGDSTQTLPETLANKLGLTTATAPGFRDLFSAWLYNGKSKAGFYWSTNSPYVRPSWWTVFRKSPGLNPAYQTIPCTVNVAATDDNPASSYVVEDNNPANIIYECLTNTDWGMGGSPSLIDTNAFLAVQQTLHSENFGLSMMWTQQATIESFINEVLDHINATMFVSPYTGLLTIKLIRGDYDPDDLFVLNESNCDVDSFQRKLWGETTNEIVVTWTNPSNEQEETVTTQDLANIAMQGGIVSDSRNYYGVRNAALAKTLANRDVRFASSPLISAEVTVDRSAWAVVPGDVCKLNYPDEGVASVAMRVMKVNYGKIGESKIKLSLIEDIFALVPVEYTAPPTSEWVDPTSNPVNFTNAKIITAPFAVMEAELGDSVMATIEYPEVTALFLAAQPNNDTYSYSLLAEELNATGGLEYTYQGNLRPVTSSTLSAPLAWQSPTSTMSIAPITVAEKPVVGGYLLIGDSAAPEDVCELAYIEADLGSNQYTIRRGILDTVPRAWSSGTRVWFFKDDYAITEPEVRSSGNNTNYKMLATTSLGTLPATSATIRPFVFSDRPWMPIRPANVIVAGVSNGEVDVVEPVATIAASWANRNRLNEPVPVLSWNAGSLSPEAGQTTTIHLYDTYDGSLIASHTGLTGTSFNIPIASFGFYPKVRVVVTAERDGYESFQAQDVTIKFPARIGYGRAWGFNYGSP